MTILVEKDLPMTKSRRPGSETITCPCAAQAEAAVFLGVGQERQAHAAVCLIALAQLKRLDFAVCRTSVIDFKVAIVALLVLLPRDAAVPAYSTRAVYQTHRPAVAALRIRTNRAARVCFVAVLYCFA